MKKVSEVEMRPIKFRAWDCINQKMLYYGDVDLDISLAGQPGFYIRGYSSGVDWVPL